MAQLSRLAKLYYKISEDLVEEDVRNLRSLLSLDEILGKAKVEKATPLEIFNMLADDATIGKGNLGFLVEILRCLGKGKLAEEAKRLEEEHKMEGRKTDDTTANVLEFSERGNSEQGDSGAAATSPRSSLREDSEPDDTDVKATTSDRKSSEGSTRQDEAPDNTEVQQVTSELASLHIREMTRLEDEPMKGLGPNELVSSEDDQDAKARLETLRAELDTPAVVADHTKQFHLYCQIGDLYRAKLYNLQSALRYYQSMLECAKALSEDTKQARAHNRLGLTYDMMSKIDEALRDHERVLDICKAVEGDKLDICVAHKNFASSLTLSGKLSEAKSNYKTALRLARETRNHIEEIDIHCKLGDLLYKQLKEPQVAHRNFTKMLSLAKDLENKYWEMLAYSRLGNVCVVIQDNELALEWHQKALTMSHESADKRDQIYLNMNVADVLGKVDRAKSLLDTSLQIAEAKGEHYGQMNAYMRMGDMQRDQLHSPLTSIHYYEQHLALATQLGDRRQEGLAYNRLGDAHHVMREYDVALEWFQKHLRISQERKDKKEEVRAHADMGNAYRFLGQIAKATSHFNTALQIAQQTGDQHGQMEVYCKMGDMQMDQLDSPRTAIQYYEQHLALARQLGDRHEEVAYNRLGRAHYDMGEYEAALEWDKEDLKISQENGDKSKQIIPQKCIADSYKALGKLDLARSHYQSALTIAKKTGNKQQQMDIYRQMGDLHREQLHEPQASLTYYTDMLALAKDLERKDKERLAYSRLGLACGDIQDYEAALEWHQKYLKMSQEDADKTEQITAHENVAGSYKALGKPDLARSQYESAMTLATETGSKTKQMDIYRSLGDLHREQLHEPQAAHKFYTDMLALAKELERKDKEMVAYNRLGLACWDMQDRETALGWHIKDLEMSQEDGDKTAQITAHHCIAHTYKALDKPDLARSHYQSAMTVAMETGNKTEQMDIYLGLGDLHREHLHKPQDSQKFYREMLALAIELERKDIERQANNRLGLACEDMQDNEAALGWHQKTLDMSQEDEDKTAQITAHQCIAHTYKALGKPDLARSHYQSAMTIAIETGNKQEQDDIAKELASL